MRITMRHSKKHSSHDQNLKFGVLTIGSWNQVERTDKGRIRKWIKIKWIKIMRMTFINSKVSSDDFEKETIKQIIIFLTR